MTEEMEERIAIMMESGKTEAQAIWLYKLYKADPVLFDFFCEIEGFLFELKDKTGAKMTKIERVKDAR